MMALGPWALLVMACGSPDPGQGRDTQDPGNDPASWDVGLAPPPPAPSSKLTFTGPPPRNLLVLSIDTLRRDKVSRYGGGTQSPFLDGLLEQSLVLDDHRSCSNWTYASLLCLFTGQSTVDLQVEPVGNRPDAYKDQATIPPEDLEGLAHWLRDAGFVTRLVSTTRFLDGEKVPGTGFQSVHKEEDADAERVSALALEATEALLEQEDPWYLHVHYRDPHFPYSAPSDFEEGLSELEPSGYALTNQAGINALEADWEGLSEEAQALVIAWLSGLQDAEIRYLDHHLSALWAELEALGALEDTLVVFVSDHGEQFFEHGGLMHYTDLFAEEAAALGAFWSRNLVPHAYAGPTNHTDLAPGVLEALGVPVPASVTGLTPGTRRAGLPRHAFFGPPGIGHGPYNTVDLDGYRLHYDWAGRLELYDLRTDPAEQDDLYGERDTMLLEWYLGAEVERTQAYVTWATPEGLDR